MDVDTMHTLPDHDFTTVVSLSDGVSDFCERSDADGNVAVYTFHLIGILGMASLSIVGNSIVIFIMTRECKLSNALNCFIVNLACSDLLQGILYAIYNVSHINVPSIRSALGTWVVCCPLLMLVLMTLMSSPYNLVAITIIRYMSVRWPLHHTHMLTKRRTYAGMAAVWTAALTCSSALYIRTKPDVWCNLCRSELHWQFYQTTGMLICSAVVPFTIMITLYISMSKIYRKHVRSMAANAAAAAGEKEDKSQKLQKREKTLSRISAFLVGYFFLSYLPFIVYTFTYTFCNCAISGYIRSSVRIILFSNTTVNFFAYIIAHQEFRRGLFRRFCYKKYLSQKRSMSSASRVDLSLNTSDQQLKGSSSLYTITNNTPPNSAVTENIKMSVKS